MVSVSYYTDPACPWSWATEPSIRKLMVQFDGELDWTFVMGGLARDVIAGTGEGRTDQAHGRLIREWLRVADRTGAPIDPLIWADGPITSSYPACMAVKAALGQARDGAYGYLRRLREGLMCERRKLDQLEALVEEGRAARLDVERLRIDLRSHGTTELFAEDLEKTKAVAAGRQPDPPVSAAGSEAISEHCSRGAGDAPLPSTAFRGEDGLDHWVFGFHPFEDYREAALRAGAQLPGGPAPTIEELVARFGRVTTAEVEAVCELPGPRAGAALFALAEQWRLKPAWRMTGYLWEPA
jgi:protein-disulfide isomerase-like protein with CxxC motif